MRPENTVVDETDPIGAYIDRIKRSPAADRVRNLTVAQLYEAFDAARDRLDDLTTTDSHVVGYCVGVTSSIMSAVAMWRACVRLDGERGAPTPTVSLGATMTLVGILTSTVRIIEDLTETKRLRRVERDWAKAALDLCRAVESLLGCNYGDHVKLQLGTSGTAV